MNFDECLKFLDNHQEELSSEMPYLGIIEIMIGTTYNQLRMKGMTRERIMQLMLCGLFYFVQKEHRLTAEDEESVLIAMAAAENSFAYCREQKEEERK